MSQGVQFNRLMLEMRAMQTDAMARAKPEVKTQEVGAPSFSDMLGQAVPKNAMLGRVISPHSFEELEVLKAPYEETVLIMLRGVLSRVNPGDYGYILGDRGTADVISNA